MALFEQIREDLFAGSPVDRPRVTVSYAQSLDGSITARRGQPLTLSGPGSMALTHQLRSVHDAILVGVGTVLADDPQLTVRLVPGADPRPAVLDSSLRTPPSARLLKSRPPAWIFTTGQAPRERWSVLKHAGAQVELMESNPSGQVDLNRLMVRMSALGIKHVMVEGGAKIITAFFASKLVDALVVTIAPVLVGGVPAVEQTLNARSDGGPAQNGFTIDRFPRLQEFRHERLGDDLILWGKPQWNNV